MDRERIKVGAVRSWSSLLVRDFRLLWLSSVATAIAVQVRYVSGLYQV